jgi:hypothetical protein
MKVIDVLKKATEKAKSNGYKLPFDLVYETGRVIDGNTYYAIIFDKDFCKAIWGEDIEFLPYENSHSHLGESVILWKWHLKNMVISDDPIKYLEEYIDVDSWDKLAKYLANQRL